MKPIIITLIGGFAITLEVIILLGFQYLYHNGPEWLMYTSPYSGTTSFGIGTIFAAVILSVLPVAIGFGLSIAVDCSTLGKK